LFLSLSLAASVEFQIYLSPMSRITEQRGSKSDCWLMLVLVAWDAWTLRFSLALESF
jgi:hypothetical protein